MSAHSQYVILFYTSFVSTFIPALIGLLRFSKFGLITRIIFFYSCLSCIVEIMCTVPITNETIIYSSQNVFAVLEAVLFFSFFYLLLSNRILRTLILLVFSALIVQFGWFTIKKGMTTPNDNFSIFEYIALVLLAGTVYLRVFLNLRRAVLTPYYIVLFNTAIFVYFSSSLVLSLFDGIITGVSQSVFENLWSLHLTTNIGFNALLGLGLWKQTNYKQQ